MGQYAGGSEQDLLMEEIRALQRRVQALEVAAPLRNASISDGGQLVVKGRAGQTLLLIGRSDNPELNAPDGNPQMVFQLFRTTGEVALEMDDPLPTVDGFQQFIAIRDRAGNVIVADDTTSGQGLSRPLIPIPFDEFAVPISTTTSATFTTLQRGTMYKQHPQIVLYLLVQTSAGTTGEIQLWNATTSQQIGSVQAIAANSYVQTVLGPFAVDGLQEDVLDIDLRARRTGGAGTIGTRVITAWGYPS